MGRRDRERARRRHAIEKARREAGREAGGEPAAKPAEAAGRRAASTRPGGNRRPAGGSPKSREEMRAAYRAQFDRKGVVGDVDVRGRVRSRAMVMHPKITRRVLFVCLPIAILGLFVPSLLLVTWVAYGIAFLGLADLARTKGQAVFMVGLSVLAFTFAVAQVVAQIQA